MCRYLEPNGLWKPMNSQNMSMTDQRIELLLKAASLALSKPLQLEIFEGEKGWHARVREIYEGDPEGTFLVTSGQSQSPSDALNNLWFFVFKLVQDQRAEEKSHMEVMAKRANELFKVFDDMEALSPKS